MAKLIGPLMSVDARGSVGDVLTYAKSGKTNYAKRYTIPMNPKTAAQTAHRLGIGFISSLWKTLTVEQKATWNELGDRLQLPPYHAYLKTNCKLWVADEPITVVAPTALTGRLIPEWGTYSFSCTGTQIPTDLTIHIERDPEKAATPHIIQVANRNYTGYAPNDIQPTRLDTVALLVPTWDHHEYDSYGVAPVVLPAPIDTLLSARVWTIDGRHYPWKTIAGSAG